VTADIDEGDVVSVSLEGASGITSINVYWNGDTAIRASDLRGDPATANYSVRYFAYDPNPGRTVTNKFSSVSGGGSFMGSVFGNKVNIPVDLAAGSKIIRVLVLYGATAVGIEPVGGTLADGQVVSVSSIGSVDSIQTKVTQQKFSEKIPSVFDNVLYTNGSLSQ